MRLENNPNKPTPQTPTRPSNPQPTPKHVPLAPNRGIPRIPVNPIKK